MDKNKDFILALDLYEKWDQTALTAHLISASCAKHFGDRNSLTLCLFAESAGTDILVSDFGNDLSTSTTSTEELEAAEVQVFAKNRLISRCINSFLCASCAFNVKQELTHPFGNVNTSAIANNTDCFLWIRRVFLLASFSSECSATSSH